MAQPHRSERGRAYRQGILIDGPPSAARDTPHPYRASQAEDDPDHPTSPCLACGLGWKKTEMHDPFGKPAQERKRRIQAERGRERLTRFLETNGERGRSQ